MTSSMLKVCTPIGTLVNVKEVLPESTLCPAEACMELLVATGTVAEVTAAVEPGIEGLVVAADVTVTTSYPYLIMPSAVPPVAVGVVVGVLVVELKFLSFILSLTSAIVPVSSSLVLDTSTVNEDTAGRLVGLGDGVKVPVVIGVTAGVAV